MAEKKKIFPTAEPGTECAQWEHLGLYKKKKKKKTLTFTKTDTAELLKCSFKKVFLNLLYFILCFHLLSSFMLS